MLLQCPRLSVLELSYNQIVAEGARSVTGVLSQCPELSTLDLPDNQIGAEGAGRLAGVLTQCLAQQALILYDNKIGAEGARILAAETGSLEGVLSHCPIGILLGKDWKGLACATTRTILSIGAKGADPSKLKS